jgi:hypothetical protein
MPTLELTADAGLTADEIASGREFVDWLGDIPSQNELQKRLQWGRPKAKAFLTHLQDPAPRPADLAPQAADEPEAAEPSLVVEAAPEVAARVPEPEPTPVAPVAVERTPEKKPGAWPLFLLAAPAFVAVWSGWVGLGELSGFGVIHPLPGIWDSFQLNTAYAIRVWLSPSVANAARRFAKWSVIAALILGALGQIAYHLMAAAHMTAAPWQITTGVATMPILVVFAGSALAHLVHTDNPADPVSA